MLGERLVGLPAPQLDALELPAQLREAVLAARAIRARGGRKRQLQYIGKLMRNVDAEPIEAALAALQAPDEAAKALLHRSERWRTRLLDDGDAALTEFVATTGIESASALRTLVHEAKAERDRGAPPRRQRELLRRLREALEGPPGD